MANCRLSSFVCSDQGTQKDELRIILVGKTGAGKSSSGNTILGRREFEAKAAAGSVTADCKIGSCVLNGKDVAVVDTPGLFDTTVCNEKIIKELAQCVCLTSPGPHAIIVVISVGRFTEEEENATKIIQDLFGVGAVKYMIVLFTRKDDLGRGQSLGQFVADSAENLKDLIQTCGGRYCGFNNKARGAELEVQRGELLALIGRMVDRNGGGCYTHEMYEEAQKAIKRREEELTREIREDEERERNNIRWDEKEAIERTEQEKGFITHKELEDIKQDYNSKMLEMAQVYEDKLKVVQDKGEGNVLKSVASDGVVALLMDGARALFGGEGGTVTGGLAGMVLGGAAGAVLSANIGRGVGVVARALSSLFKLIQGNGAAH